MKWRNNLTKMLGCLIAMFGYGFVYSAFIKQPLLRSVEGLPKPLHDVIFLAALLPVVILGACAVAFYVKNQRARTHGT